ncbi:M1 family metallopeptidase [Caulobacter endophyticus]|uniref:Aminopeptidase N n=1 Tax=Caulobacter endophyticus TaxID=2172652 RepID=A0A2T9JSK7_9CAUL|nr:M1 family metallopeptidase [Caulobacter endophyticus]PVM86693.1 peptidase M1 [Caulobacter endophyticus]
MSVSPVQRLALAAVLPLLIAAAPAKSPKPARAAPTAQTLATGGALKPDQAGVHIEHVDLSIEVFPRRKAIAGEAVLALRADRELPVIVLDLDRELAVSAVSLDGRELSSSAWRNPDGRLSITPSAPIPAGHTTAVRIRYAGVPVEAKRAPWDGGFVWTRTPDGRPWIATAVQGEGCDLFWPCIDHPTGEPDLVDLRITVPAGLSAPSGGILIDVAEAGDGRRTFHWRMKTPNTYAVALNIGPYVHLTAAYRSRFGDSFPIEFWAIEGNEAKGRNLLGQFAPMLDFYEAMIGPYPFRSEKMGAVETPHLGMEHQTLNAYGAGYAQEIYGFDWLLNHELAHEWFGNQMTNVDWDDMWLHEAFGTYMQPLYSQWLHGDMEYMVRLNEMRVKSFNRFPIVSGKPMEEEAVYDAKIGPGTDIYYKGANMLHSLRALIGDEAFFKATRVLVYGRPDPRPGNFAPRYAVTADFIKAVNEATGADYGWFFDAYLRHAELPDLVETREGEDLVLAWKSPTGRFPMPVEVKVGGKVITLPMADGTGRVKVGDVAPVIVDPASKILRRQPYLEAYHAWKTARDAAAKAPPAKPRK